MKVIVLCSGRTGSFTFYRSCQALSNFSVAHESKSHITGSKRFELPDQHIEIDNRLVWQLGSLEHYVGDNAHYVHLKRERNEVKKSFIKRIYQPKSIFYSYCEAIKKSTPENLDQEELETLADDLLDNIDHNIDHFLKNKTHQMVFQLEEYERAFPKFWQFIHAEGNYEQALSEWSKKHNPSSASKTNLQYDLKRMLKRYF